MKRPIVIVDPRSSGTELAPAFAVRGIPSIAVTFETMKNRLGYGTEVRTSDFIEVLPNQPGLVEMLRRYEPLAVLPGAESGVPLANELAEALTPRFANDSSKSRNRLHKAHMQEALEKAGVPALKTLNASSEEEVERWLKENELLGSPLVIKPPISAGSEKVFHVAEGGDWRPAFREVWRGPSNITGKANETAVVQEQAIGTEFAVGTVSANGKHHLAHLIQYNKISFNGRKTVYDHVEFVGYRDELHGAMFDYAKRVLDALGVRLGAAHNEIMLTSKGPRLIESVPRMTGGPVVRFARAATGSSQADKLVEAIIDGDVRAKDYVLKQPVVPVFLRSPSGGVVSNVDALKGVSQLPTLLDQFIWFKDGDVLPQTVDYLTSIGIVALSGDREAIFRDYEKLREMESKLVFS